MKFGASWLAATEQLLSFSLSLAPALTQGAPTPHADR